jgi:hypothetical protein
MTDIESDFLVVENFTNVAEADQNSDEPGEGENPEREKGRLIQAKVRRLAHRLAAEAMRDLINSSKPLTLGIDANSADTENVLSELARIRAYHSGKSI